MHADIAGLIFDLDGVLVDTAKYHYLAWRRLAQELGLDLTPQTNEKLKGVSRIKSLEIILADAGRSAGAAEMQAMAARKNGWYLEHILRMTPSEVLANVKPFVRRARVLGLRTAIGSASKNTPTILERTGLAQLFDAVVDGNVTSAAKPDPEVFLKAAQALGLAPQRCVVFEDSASGVEAARRAGMRVVGIGRPQVLADADIVVRGFSGLTPSGVLRQLEPQPA
ncbi:MAG TPA: beta-phosphoglucomutase [Rubrivivax sp.]|nr:beta-phosphoglucomutase [Rubrivivax sp.]